MLILLGSDGNNLESLVAKRFGHANYYILFNSESQSFNAFENNDEGHNHDNLRNFLDKGVEVFIVGNIGPYAFEIINTPKSKVYLARKMLVREAIKKFIKGELLQLSEPTAKRSIDHGHHSHRHRYGKTK
jgi:predicted Fe-Mo cluster-binding NifX family protein